MSLSRLSRLRFFRLDDNVLDVLSITFNNTNRLFIMTRITLSYMLAIDSSYLLKRGCIGAEILLNFACDIAVIHSAYEICLI